MGRMGSEVAKEAADMVLLDDNSVSYTHLRAHETVLDLVCRLLLENKKYYCLQTTVIFSTNGLQVTTL